jgi:hypothetical protein
MCSCSSQFCFPPSNLSSDFQTKIVDNQKSLTQKRILVRVDCHLGGSIDTFMVWCKGNEQANMPECFKKYIDRIGASICRYRFWFCHKIATEIGDIKSRVREVCECRERYKLDGAICRPTITVDPRLLLKHTNATELVGIYELRDEMIKILGGKERTTK